MNPSHLIARIKEAFGGSPIAHCSPQGRDYPIAFYKTTQVDGNFVVNESDHIVTCHSYKELEAFYFTVSAVNEKGKTVWRYDR